MSVKGHSGDYFIPDPSPWPIIGMVSLLTTLFGGVLAMNGVAIGSYIVTAGLLLFFFLLFGWFRDVIGENLNDCYNKQVDTSFRMGMFWFIASEVFFFLSFFGSLYYIRNIALPWLGG
ncbi:MAG: cytochrome c oxidase subunit 3, partial [Candidatus Thiodiazotropha sp.]